MEVEIYFFPGTRMSEREEQIVSGNENVRTRTRISFPRKTARMEKSHPYRTVMARCVKVVRKGDQILWQLLVDMIQIFHAVLRYFYIRTPLRVTANLKFNI
jgi:hypothetical protein